ncbi:MAG: MotA/TolQ/ExbB proton channel family protein [Leptolyngbyaceae bacterium]|nr:MotA/TolQ/ExbB proton channel family protein [Leptolyngbyaceae bacterium]
MKRMIDVFVSGGVVMIPLLIFSLLAIALIIERLVFWSRINRRQRRVVREMLSLFQHESDSTVPRLKQNANLPIVRIFLEALEIPDLSPVGFRLALESATQAELPLLRRFNTAFDIIISAAPLLGLLGTILGLIRSFSSLELGDLNASNAAAVTGGISEALVSTAAGMAIAIFTLIFANLFRGFYRRQLALIQEYGGQLELLYLRRYEEEHGRSLVTNR